MSKDEEAVEEGDVEQKKGEEQPETPPPPTTTPPPSPSKKIKVRGLKTRVKMPLNYGEWLDLMRRYDRGEIKTIDDQPASINDISEALGVSKAEVVNRFKIMREAETYRPPEPRLDETMQDELGALRREVEGLREDMSVIAHHLAEDRKAEEKKEITSGNYQIVEMPDGTKIYKPVRAAPEEIAVTRAGTERLIAEKLIDGLDVGKDVAQKLVDRIDKFVGTMESIALARSGIGPKPSTEAQAEEALKRLEERVKEGEKEEALKRLERMDLEREESE